MPCYHPWTPSPQLGLRPGLSLACGQCIGCRLRRSQEWAARCVHETKSHPFNSWLTLTYDDEHLPSRYFTGAIHPTTKRKIYSGSLNKIDVQKFIRALRKALCKKGEWNKGNFLYLWKQTPATPEHSKHIGGTKRRRLLHLTPQLRYYYGGEYGETYGRPHYHLCLFGIDLGDKRHIETTKAGFKLYESKSISKLWPHGQHRIGELNAETAAYTARYIMKKINGDKAKKHYEKICQETGEVIQQKPEFNDMSRMPGIGKQWYDKYKKDIYKKQTSALVFNNYQQRPPRYYDEQYKRENPHHLAKLKLLRQAEARKKKEDRKPERLIDAEKIALSRTQSLKQKL